MKNVVAALALGLLAGCASTPSHLTDPALPGSAPLVASAAELRAFSGLWRGQFDAVDARRDATIEFRLEPGEMLFNNPTQKARIQWVRVTGNKLAGATETWFDPERNEEVYTVFEAELVGSTLKGTIRERVRMKWSEVATITAVRVAD